MKADFFLNRNSVDPQVVAKIVEELEKRGFYSDGHIIYSEEQGLEVKEIFDKYLVNK